MPLTTDPLNIIISGVGGQGNILASDLISRTFCEDGYFVSVGETYGATQRGGSVISHIRVSSRHPYGPLIPLGEGHIIVGFEPLEVYRVLREYGHETVRIVMNDRPFYPLAVLQKKSAYPPFDQLMSRIEHAGWEVRVISGTALARDAGNAQTQNVVMVGAFAGLKWVPLEKKKYLKSIQETFSGARLEVNTRAFELGYQAVSG
jgi:indolepyruvate ferredoxin oxidoreductase beta subunit